MSYDMQTRFGNKKPQIVLLYTYKFYSALYNRYIEALVDVFSYTLCKNHLITKISSLQKLFLSFPTL